MVQAHGCLTGHHTGIRLEEILILTWDRMDLEKGRIFLSSQLTKKGRNALFRIDDLSERGLTGLRSGRGCKPRCYRGKKIL